MALREITLAVGSMTCRHCVRQVTSLLRDVTGVEMITADAKGRIVVLRGTMTVADVRAAFVGSKHAPQVVNVAAATER